MGNDTRHFLGHAAAKAVGLHEVDGREKAGLAKEVGPGIGDLRPDFLDAAGKRKLLECGRHLGAENQAERVIGPVGL